MGVAHRDTCRAGGRRNLIGHAMGRITAGPRGDPLRALLMNPDAALVLREDLDPVNAPVPKQKGVAGEWFECEAYGVTPMLKRASFLAAPDFLTG